jgi:hypothetical protein
MAIRVSVTPDKDGLIHITCGGADLELEVAPQAGAAAPSAGPLPDDPGPGPILSLIGRAWSPPDVVVTPSGGRPLSIHAHVIDVHALYDIARKLPGEGRRPGVATVHVDLRR